MEIDQALGFDLYKSQKNYWIDKLSEEVSLSKIPFDFHSANQNEYHMKKEEFIIDEKLAYQLISLSNESTLNLYAVLLTAVKILINKYTDLKDITVMSPVSQSKPGDLQQLLPLRDEFIDQITFKELLLKVRTTIKEANSNKNIDVKTVLNYLNISTNSVSNSLCQTMVLLENIHGTDTSNANVNLNFSFIQEANGIKGAVEYNSMVYESSSAVKIIKHLIYLLSQVIENKNLKISEIDLITEEEKNKLLYEYNNTYAKYPKSKALTTLFHDQAIKSSNNIAVVCQKERLSYEDLDQKSNQLARTLRNKGVTRNSIVGIMMDRSSNVIVAIMGILKAGGAYLPIDINYPIERVNYILKDSKASLLITEGERAASLEFCGELLDIQDKAIYLGSCEAMDNISMPEDLAYAIYTSGSTGQPKGVLIEHKNVVNLVYALNKIVYSHYDRSMKIALVAPFIFDASVQQIFAALLLGHSLYIVPEDIRRDGNGLTNYYNQNFIDISDGTPMHLTLMANSTNKINTIQIRHFIIGGEVLLPQTIKEFKQRFSESTFHITNIYGPTECCVDCASYEIESNEVDELKSVPIGTPMANEAIYILDRQRRLMIEGGIGEIAISGDGVGRGYLNNPDLNNEKFLVNPFIENQKLYLTGDLGRWLPNGRIEFVGRIDNQIKLRGYRIELDEIENRLLEHEFVKEATVIVRTDHNMEQYICSYVVSDKSIKELSLKEYLLKSFPEYMIPLHFIKLDQMPLTLNGKVNKRALPEPELNNILTEYEAPRNSVEEKLAKIWCKVLGVEKVGINDDFFQLGGHSLKAIVLIARISKELNIEVELNDIFDFPTIKALNNRILNNKDELYSNIIRQEQKEYYATSSAQKRMYILQQFNKSEVAYNMPAAFELKGEIKKEKIEECFQKLIQRHDSFRTYFETQEDEIVQKIAKECEFSIQEQIKEGNIDEIFQQFIKPFDLNKAPLLRVNLVKNHGNSYLLINMHHIISDGISINILIEDFIALYNGKDLEPLQLQYKDFAVWQNKLFESSELEKQKDYWFNQFSDGVPVINLPYDYERPLKQCFDGDNVSIETDEEITSCLRKIAKETGTTMHMVLLSALYILLAKYSGEEDVVVGIPIAGRTRADVQNIVGLFVNTLALRNKPESKKRFKDFLEEVKDNSLMAYKNQSYQFETLVEKLDIKRDASRNPLFDVMFNLVDTALGTVYDLENLHLTQYSMDSKTAKFDLALNVLDKGNVFVVDFNYCTKLFKKGTMSSLSRFYLNILKEITSNIDVKISDIELLTEQEKKQICNEFNNTRTDYPGDSTIQELFEEQVELVPDHIAVVYESKEMTYRELNSKSNQLANLLRNKGVTPNTIVGLMVEQDMDMIIGILGIMKAGGSYLPIDPENPIERIVNIFEDSNTQILVSCSAIASKFGEPLTFINETILLDKSSEIKEQSTENLSNLNTSMDLAYTMYTSGSTGKPKGSLILHKGVIRLFKNTNYIEFDQEDVVLQISNYMFDGSVIGIFGALLNGAKLVLVRRDIQIDIVKLTKLIVEEGITKFLLTTVLFNTLVDYDIECLKKVKKIIFGGEAVSYSHAKKAFEYLGEDRIINAYGPTEGTVISTTYPINKIDEDRKKIPIGKPISNTKVYILDKDNKILPIGVTGEICIAGDGLIRGYLNREELTKEKFIQPATFSEVIYKTGDYGRWLPDGNIEFLGRMDHQIKMNGLRIELGEIEVELLHCQGVKEAFVTQIQNDNGIRYLCAYLVADPGIDINKIKSQLNSRLPYYMLPADYLMIDHMPLNRNGKLDIKALPVSNIQSSSEAIYEEPKNDMEAKLQRIWQSILGTERIGVNDQFFSVGGDSMKATILAANIYKTFDYEISLAELFRASTIRLQAEFISGTKKDNSIYSNPIKRVVRENIID